jgi:hypothetical protein
VENGSRGIFGPRYLPKWRNSESRLMSRLASSYRIGSCNTLSRGFQKWCRTSLRVPPVLLRVRRSHAPNISEAKRTVLFCLLSLGCSLALGLLPVSVWFCLLRHSRPSCASSWLPHQQRRHHRLTRCTLVMERCLAKSMRTLCCTFNITFRVEPCVSETALMHLGVVDTQRLQRRLGHNT